MATGLSRPNYINGANLDQSTVLVRLVVNKDNNPSADTVDTSTTHFEMTLAQFSDLIVANKPAIAALTGSSTAADIVAALQA